MVATLFEDYFFSEAPHLLPSSRELHRRYEIGPPLHSTVSTQKFRNPATPFHFMAPFTHPTSAALTARYQRVFLSCRVARSQASHHIPLRASSLGEHSPPVFRPGHGDATSPLHRGHGHGAYLTTSLGPGRQGSRPPLHHGLGLGPTLVTSLGPRAGTGLPSPPAAAR